MSRTDKTRPFWIKVCDSASNYKEVHNHAKRLLRDENGEFVRVPIPGKFWGTRQATRMIEIPFTECDLPKDPRKDQGNYDGCHWTYTREFMSRGEARCGCRTCSQDDYYRNENRKARHAAKREAQNWKDEY